MEGSASDRTGGISESKEARNRDGPDAKESGEQDDADRSSASLRESDEEREELKATSGMNEEHQRGPNAGVPGRML